jgi:GH24 family phage-related lysozyme (muramidase)|tara:strand:+ start:28 stop:471 length:444 start_codon:yes stop_codon:yes gene_type:complete
LIYLLLILLVDEGFRGEAYQLPGEAEWTIGYGHYGSDVREGDTITEVEAKILLGEDVRERLISITEMIPKFNTFPEYLRGSLFSEHYRGSIRQSPKTRKLINEGRFMEAAEEFLDNDQYRNAYQLGIPGIRLRMERLADELRKYGEK